MEGFSLFILGYLCALQPARESQQWQEYNFLCQCLPNSKEHRLVIRWLLYQKVYDDLTIYRHSLGEAIQRFVVNCTQDKQLTIERLYGMPLVNFLTDTSTPYEDILSTDCEQLIKMWNHLCKAFNLKDVRSNISKTKVG